MKESVINTESIIIIPFGRWIVAQIIHLSFLCFFRKNVVKIINSMYNKETKIILFKINICLYYNDG